MFNENSDNLEEKYAILEKLGESPFGFITKVREKATSREFVVKTLEKSRICDQEDIDRITREILILRKIAHKNVIQLIEIIESQEELHLVLEYCEGAVDLQEYICGREKKRMEESEAAYVFKQILEALSYLQSLSIAHRDIKPENILITPTKTIKLIDFGLANISPSTNLLKTPCGSPVFTAPEVLTGGYYSAFSADVWSAGVVLYCMLVGNLPFEEENPVVLYEKILAADYETPEFLSKDAKNVLSAVLQANCEKRASIGELLSFCWVLQPERAENLVEEEYLVEKAKKNQGIPQDCKETAGKNRRKTDFVKENKSNLARFSVFAGKQAEIAKKEACGAEDQKKPGNFEENIGSSSKKIEKSKTLGGKAEENRRMTQFSEQKIKENRRVTEFSGKKSGNNDKIFDNNGTFIEKSKDESKRRATANLSAKKQANNENNKEFPQENDKNRRTTNFDVNNKAEIKRRATTNYEANKKDEKARNKIMMENESRKPSSNEKSGQKFDEQINNSQHLSENDEKNEEINLEIGNDNNITKKETPKKIAKSSIVYDKNRRTTSYVQNTAPETKRRATTNYDAKKHASNEKKQFDNNNKNQLIFETQYNNEQPEEINKNSNEHNSEEYDANIMYENNEKTNENITINEKNPKLYQDNTNRRVTTYDNYTDKAEVKRRATTNYENKNSVSNKPLEIKNKANPQKLQNEGSYDHLETQNLDQIDKNQDEGNKNIIQNKINESPTKLNKSSTLYHDNNRRTTNYDANTKAEIKRRATTNYEAKNKTYSNKPDFIENNNSINKISKNEQNSKNNEENLKNNAEEDLQEETQEMETTNQHNSSEKKARAEVPNKYTKNSTLFDSDNRRTTNYAVNSKIEETKRRATTNINTKNENISFEKQQALDSSSQNQEIFEENNNIEQNDSNTEKKEAPKKSSTQYDKNRRTTSYVQNSTPETKRRATTNYDSKKNISNEKVQLDNKNKNQLIFETPYNNEQPEEINKNLNEDHLENSEEYETNMHENNENITKNEKNPKLYQENKNRRVTTYDNYTDKAEVKRRATTNYENKNSKPLEIKDKTTPQKLQNEENNEYSNVHEDKKIQEIRHNSEGNIDNSDKIINQSQESPAKLNKSSTLFHDKKRTTTYDANNKAEIKRRATTNIEAKNKTFSTKPDFNENKGLFNDIEEEKAKIQKNNSFEEEKNLKNQQSDEENLNIEQNNSIIEKNESPKKIAKSSTVYDKNRRTTSYVQNPTPETKRRATTNYDAKKHVSNEKLQLDNKNKNQLIFETTYNNEHIEQPEEINKNLNEDNSEEYDANIIYGNNEKSIENITKNEKNPKLYHQDNKNRRVTTYDNYTDKSEVKRRATTNYENKNSVSNKPLEIKNKVETQKLQNEETYDHLEAQNFDQIDKNQDEGNKDIIIQNKINQSPTKLNKSSTLYHDNNRRTTNYDANTKAEIKRRSTTNYDAKNKTFSNKPDFIENNKSNNKAFQNELFTNNEENLINSMKDDNEGNIIEETEIIPNLNENNIERKESPKKIAKSSTVYDKNRRTTSYVQNSSPETKRRATTNYDAKKHASNEKLQFENKSKNQITEPANNQQPEEMIQNLNEDHLENSKEYEANIIYENNEKDEKSLINSNENTNKNNQSPTKLQKSSTLYQDNNNRRITTFDNYTDKADVKRRATTNYENKNSALSKPLEIKNQTTPQKLQNEESIDHLNQKDNNLERNQEIIQNKITKKINESPTKLNKSSTLYHDNNRRNTNYDANTKADIKRRATTNYEAKNKTFSNKPDFIENNHTINKISKNEQNSKNEENLINSIKDNNEENIIEETQQIPNLNENNIEKKESPKKIAKSSTVYDKNRRTTSYVQNSSPETKRRATTNYDAKKNISNEKLQFENKNKNPISEPANNQQNQEIIENSNDRSFSEEKIENPPEINNVEDQEFMNNQGNFNNNRNSPVKYNKSSTVYQDNTRRTITYDTKKSEEIKRRATTNYDTKKNLSDNKSSLEKTLKKPSNLTNSDSFQENFPQKSQIPLNNNEKIEENTESASKSKNSKINDKNRRTTNYVDPSHTSETKRRATTNYDSKTNNLPVKKFEIEEYKQQITPQKIENNADISFKNEKNSVSYENHSKFSSLNEHSNENFNENDEISGKNLAKYEDYETFPMDYLEFISQKNDICEENNQRKSEKNYLIKSKNENYANEMSDEEKSDNNEEEFQLNYRNKPQYIREKAKSFMYEHANNSQDLKKRNTIPSKIEEKKPDFLDEINKNQEKYQENQEKYQENHENIKENQDSGEEFEENPDSSDKKESRINENSNTHKRESIVLEPGLEKVYDVLRKNRVSFYNIKKVLRNPLHENEECIELNHSVMSKTMK